jgi:hypothetical protein
MPSVKLATIKHVFHDHLPKDKLRGDEIKKLLDVEQALRHQEPFASLAQHMHFVCGSKTRGELDLKPND